MDELHDCARSMELAKKLIVCRKCGAKNPERASVCGSCASALRGSSASSAGGRRSIWQTEHRNRAALNLILVALFAFILAADLVSGASPLYIAVVLVFLCLSTMRFIFTWRRAMQE